VTITWQPPPGYPEYAVFRGEHIPFEQTYFCPCGGPPGHAVDSNPILGHHYTYYVVTMSADRKTFSRPTSINVDVPAPTAASVPAVIPNYASEASRHLTKKIAAPRSLAASVVMNRDASSITVSSTVTITWQAPSDELPWAVYRADDHKPFAQARNCSCAGESGRAFDSSVVLGHRYTYYVVTVSQDRRAFSYPTSITVVVPSRP
jgi:hypothetical protein